MRNSGIIESTWKVFCAENALMLNEEQKRYLSGVTQVYTAYEVYNTYQISYYHRYELPDMGVRPEELSIQLKSETSVFRPIQVKQVGFLRSLFRANRIHINAEGGLSMQIKTKLESLCHLFTGLEIHGTPTNIRLKITEFPTSVNELNLLRRFIIDLSKEMTNGKNKILK